MKSFGSDNHAPVHPDVLAAIVAANDGDAPRYGADPWTARREAAVHRALRAGRRGAPGVQRHRGQRAVAGHAAALVRGRDLRRHRAHPHRRVRRAGAAARLQAAAGRDRRRPDLGRGGGRAGLGRRRRAPRAAAGAVDHPVHRARHPLPARGRPGAGRLGARPRPVRAHGRGPAGQRRGRARGLTRRGQRRLRGRRAVLRRYEERRSRRRGRGRTAAGPGRRPPVPAQAGDAARLEDAVRGGAVRRAAVRRPVAAQRRAGQRDRGPAGREGGGPARGEDHPAGRGERGLRDPAVRGDRAAAGGVSVLRLGREHRRGALDDLVRHHGPRTSTTSSRPWPGWSARVAPCHGWSSTSR